MPIGIGVPLKITLQGLLMNQQVAIVQWYTTDGAAFLTADAAAVGEAYWNHIKATWRALHRDNTTDRTIAVLVSEPGPTGAFGEFAIPTAEQVGTRPAGSLGGFQPSFVAAGIRQTVATRVTRPGQKRVWGLMEADVGDNSELIAGYVTLLDAFATVICNPIVLGAPVATGGLVPIVARTVPPNDTVTAQQDVVGYVINPNATSQVSRKIGRGA